MDDFYVYLVDMPTTVHEMILPCVGGYTIYLNSRLSRQGQLTAYQHALKHVERNDWEKYDVQQIEFEAHFLEQEDAP